MTFLPYDQLYLMTKLPYDLLPYGRMTFLPNDLKKYKCQKI